MSFRARSAPFHNLRGLARRSRARVGRQFLVHDFPGLIGMPLVASLSRHGTLCRTSQICPGRLSARRLDRLRSGCIDRDPAHLRTQSATCRTKQRHDPKARAPNAHRAVRTPANRWRHRTDGDRAERSAPCSSCKGPLAALQELVVRTRIMPRATKITAAPELTLEERRERRQLRREKQREDNVQRVAKMHAARLKMEATSLQAPTEPKAAFWVGCSGWRYWNWRDLFYAEVPQPDSSPGEVAVKSLDDPKPKP